MGSWSPIGTGFFVEVPQGSRPSTYFVTARHVIEGREEVFIRLNVRNWDPSSIQPGILFHRTLVKDGEGNSLWFVHDERAVDIAVLPTAPDPQAEEPKVISPSMFATRDIVAREGVVEGDDIFFTGLLPHYYQPRRNFPVVRHGRITLLTDEPVNTPEGSTVLYFAECQSFLGNSGSPVFLNIGPRIFLLGVMKGYFYREELEHPHDAHDAAKAVARFQENIGIAAVTPVDKLKEILFHPRLTRERDRRQIP